jgi:hypothetical protein
MTAARMAKIERVTLSAYEKRESTKAAKNFEKHVITKRDHRSWLCHDPSGSGFWFEAFVSGPILTVVGDFDPTSFAYGSGSPRSLIDWIGMHAICDRYVLQKASIGTGHDGDVRSFDVGVWFNSALEEAEIYHLSNETIDTSRPVDLDALIARGVPEWLVDMIEDVAISGNEAERLRDMPSEAGEAEAYRWGEVPSSRVVLAHAALRHLSALLVAEEAA